MSRWIAFLRAVNVGGRTIKMDYLRRLFEELGYDRVETFIASGNVIFDSAESDPRNLERAIEAHLADSLGYRVDTFIRSAAEIAEVAACDPFGVRDGEESGTLYVLFLAREPPPEAAERVAALETDTDRFHIEGREFYWRCLTKLSETRVNDAALGKAIGVKGTMRNANTVRRLAAKYGGSNE